MNIKLTFFFFLLLTATIPVLSQKTEKEIESLKKLVDTMTTSQVTYDAAALDRIFTEDFIEISPIGELDPREKVISFYSLESKVHAAGVDVNVEEDFRSIRLYGDTAVVIAELSFIITQQGKTMPPRKMMITVVGRKATGVWKIASAQYTSVRPTPPLAMPAPKKP